MPEVFFIGHSVGIVLAKATYGNRLVLYQNTTVGKNHGEAPVARRRRGDVPEHAPSSAAARSAPARSSPRARASSTATRRATAWCSRARPASLVFKPPKRDVLADLFR